MLTTLIELIGLSIEDPIVIELFKSNSTDYPKKITCTPNNSTLKTKLNIEGLIPCFGIGRYSRYFKPIPARNKGSYIAQFMMIEVTKKYKDELPFGVKYNMTDNELTSILGDPRTIQFMGSTTIWRKNISPKHEIHVDDYTPLEGPKIRTITIQFIFEEDK
jgi:hypothetical protein